MSAGAVGEALAPALARCSSCAVVPAGEGAAVLTALSASCSCDLDAAAECGCALPEGAVAAASALRGVLWVERLAPARPFNAFARGLMETTDLLNSPTIAAEFGACPDPTCNLTGYFPISQLPTFATIPGLRRAQATPAPTPCSAPCASMACGSGFGVCSSTTPIAAQLSGAGQLIQVVDTGLDALSPFFYDPASPVVPSNALPSGAAPPLLQHRKVASYWSYADGHDGATNAGWSAARGHGTHVAGSIAGNATGLGALLQAEEAAVLTAQGGAAPGARLLVTDVGCDTPGGCSTPALTPAFPPRAGPCAFNSLCLPADVTQLFAVARAQGARISSNAWGTTAPRPVGVPGALPFAAITNAIDAYVWQNPDHLLVFAGGDGAPLDTPVGGLSPQGLAKNVLTVGGIMDGLGGHLAKTRGLNGLPPLYQAPSGRACQGLIASAGVQSAEGLDYTAPQKARCPPAPPTIQQCYTLFLSGQNRTLPAFGGFPLLDPFNVDPNLSRESTLQVPYAIGQRSNNALPFPSGQAELALCCMCSLQMVVEGCAASGDCTDPTIGAPGQPSFGAQATSAIVQGFATTYNGRFTNQKAARGLADDNTGQRIKVRA